MKPEAEAAADRMFMALRQCATHHAGPLRAVAEAVHLDLDRGSLDELQDSVRDRLADMAMPDDRRETIDGFLAAIFDGALR